MAALSDYLEAALINHLLRGTAYTAPASVHVGLLTAAPSDSGGGTEVSGGSYARVAVAAGTGSWAAPGTNGTTSNAGAITFPAPSANWGAVTHMGAYDAATGGNLLFYAPLTTSKTINNGDAAPSFAAGALTLQLDN